MAAPKLDTLRKLFRKYIVAISISAVLLLMIGSFFAGRAAGLWEAHRRIERVFEAFEDPEWQEKFRQGMEEEQRKLDAMTLEEQEKYLEELRKEQGLD